MYTSFFFSPRGFSNEGTYIYGKTEDVMSWYDDNYHAGLTRDWEWTRHQTLDAAREYAERAAEKDRRECPSYEIIAVDALSVDEMCQEDW